MRRRLFISVDNFYVRIALIEDHDVTELIIESRDQARILSNIYLGKITKVFPGMQAAFVDIGLDKDAFLHKNDIIRHPSMTQDSTDAAHEVDDEEVTDIHDVVLFEENGSTVSDSPASIEKLVQPGDVVMVQITRGFIGMKGPRATRHVTIPGRFLVLMPTIKNIGVSKRIESPEERERLWQIANSIAPEGIGLIVRTAATGQTKEAMEQDVAYLEKVWESILELRVKSTPPTLLYHDMDPIFRALRDTFDVTIDQVLIDSAHDYVRSVEFVSRFAPHLVNRIVLCEDTVPLFERYNIESAIEKALNRKVWLPSGGHIVIDPTEALVAVDVNTGRFVGAVNLEETVLKTNLEAAEAIARQIRLRNIGGIIVIDFIDMAKPENREKVVEALQKAFASDKARVNIGEFSPIGLVEMTRKRLRRNLHRVLMQPCSLCSGTGWIRQPRFIAAQILREVQRNLLKSHINAMTIYIHPQIQKYIQPQIDAINASDAGSKCRIGIRTEPQRKLMDYDIDVR